MGIQPEARAVTTGPKHHFFGYYDKSPWDSTGRYMLGMETSFMDRSPTGDDPAVIGLIDLEDGNRWIPLDETRAWHWQQGAMLQWLPNAPDRLVIYNQKRRDEFISIIRDIKSGETRTLPRAIYAVSPDGRSAITLNFARLHRTRPGYGYPGGRDPWAGELEPGEDGLYWMDLATGDSRLIISIAQMAQTNRKHRMKGCVHWFNHLQFNPDGTRFIFLHRWRTEDWKIRDTRFYTANPDGTDIYCLNDDDMTSHFDWYSPQKAFAWARRHGRGDHYYMFTDRTEEIEPVGEGILTTDGHCSFSPDRRWLLTDTYPDREHKRTLILYDMVEKRRVDLGRFLSPPVPFNEIRCDLHPRWSRDGRQVCFDSVHEGSRQMYVVDVGEK